MMASGNGGSAAAVAAEGSVGASASAAAGAGAAAAESSVAGAAALASSTVSTLASCPPIWLMRELPTPETAARATQAHIENARITM